MLFTLTTTRLVSLLAIGLTAGVQAQVSLNATWKSSTQAALWTDKPAVTLQASVPLPSSTTASRLFFNSDRTYQTITGWGGCFNERGWKAMEGLGPAAREAVMRALFDPQTGLKLTIGRTPLGSNDFSIAPYSYNETPGDYAMTNFSIAQDETYLLPYIKAALAIQPGLYLWAVPWSPPSWMKSNNSLINGGNIKDDEQTLSALAKYFVLYVQAYQAKGVEVRMVMPQNEPNISNNYPTCLWTGVQFNQFIGRHLGPALNDAGLSTKIFLGSYNETNRGGYSYWVAPSMQDPLSKPYIAGVGCQWSADGTMSETRMIHPNLPLMQTEVECNHPNNFFTNTNDFTYAEYQYQLAKKWFNAGAGSNILWNLVLDQTGLSNGNWAQCSPIVVNTTTQAVTYTPFYYLYKHFSYFVQPGARLATSHSSWGDKIAFENPDGSMVAVIGNSASQNFDVTLNFNGWQSGVITLPARSFNTFTTPSSKVMWRQKNFGTADNAGSAADWADADGDGVLNDDEFIAGTDPNSGGSYLRVSQMQAGAHGASLVFPTSSGKIYRIDYSNTLAPATWTTLQDNIHGTGSTIQILDPNAAVVPSRFYRVVLIGY